MNLLGLGRIGIPIEFEDMALSDRPPLPIRDTGGWHRMAVSLGSGEPPTDVLRLTGGLECETYLFRLGAERLVVKVFTNTGSRASTEFGNLSPVSAAGVPTPEPVHFDHRETGSALPPS
jgi:hypothetical protein